MRPVPGRITPLVVGERARVPLLSALTIDRRARSTIHFARMKREMKLLFACLSVVAFSLSAWSQAPPRSGTAAPPQTPKVSPLAEYAGIWTATFDGKIWLSLQLELHGDQLTGSLVHAHSFEMNDNGELKSVSEDQVSDLIIAAVLNPDGLLMSVNGPDSQDTDRYMMRLVTSQKDAADLKMIAMSMPPGMPKPRPWRLVKSGIAPTNKVAAPR